ncbi:MAG TPA: Stk1 family PASTA domain-containing Ser/Thr kinase [Mycobacteriales bacterium]|nr:Stk1 family PASTA domain-containing Ser/Thr kinase [Mycobacteriales bacterium]
MSPPKPTLLGGRYQLGEAIGIGGMAEVFRGTDVRLGRDVAVKVLRADLAREATFQARFRREAQSAASLNAPCIVSVFDTGESDGVPYIVMEYVAGRTLREVLQTEGRLLPQRALELAADICAALDVAHAAGIVHRDIKPGNVMVTAQGEVKVMDFGIARAVADASSDMTQTAAVVGTAAYLSPEQARGEHVDARSDIYSTGCLLYEILTGSPPFNGDSPVAVAYQHVREEPEPPSAYDPSLDASIDAVVLKAMAKNPANRYQSADEFRLDLLRAARRDPVHATPYQPGLDPVPVFVQTLHVAEESHRGRKVVAVLFALVLLGVMVGVALLVRNVLGGDAGLVTAPRVIGMTQTEAATRLADFGLTVGRVEERFAELPVGLVVDQSPTQGFSIRRGGEISLVLSKGIEMTVVPPILQLSQLEAIAQLEEAKLGVDQVIPRDVNLPAGQVLQVLPAVGSRVRAGTKVDLVVASGKVQVPDVRGRSKEEAERLLVQAGFSVEVEFRPDLGPPDRVLDQTPVNTLAGRGTIVKIVVSQVPPSPSPAPTPSAEPFPGDPSPTPF